MDPDYETGSSSSGSEDNIYSKDRDEFVTTRLAPMLAALEVQKVPNYCTDDRMLDSSCFSDSEDDTAGTPDVTPSAGQNPLSSDASLALPADTLSAVAATGTEAADEATKRELYARLSAEQLAIFMKCLASSETSCRRLHTRGRRSLEENVPEGMLYCYTNDHHAPKADFIDEDGNECAACSKCREKQQEQRKLLQENVPEGMRYCSLRHHYAPEADFVAVDGNGLHRCNKCQEELHGRRKWLQENVPEGMRYCAHNHHAPEEDFAGEDGDAWAACSKCREKEQES